VKKEEPTNDPAFRERPGLHRRRHAAGLLAAKHDVVALPKNPHVLVRRNLDPGKVGLVSGGGSGHEPGFLGYLGRGLLDAVAIGEVFASPPAQAFADAMTAADTGAGVVCLFGNYAGDTMNVRMAARTLEAVGKTVRSVIARDDIASAPRESASARHGLVGGLVMWKVAGALAAEGAPLEDVLAVAQGVANTTRSLCVGLAPLTIPAVGRPGFTIEPGTMEVGIGHHGEPGVRKVPLESADAIAVQLTGHLLADFGFDTPRRLAVLLSGLGATPLMELYVLYGAVAAELEKAGHTVARTFVGDYVTSLDMNGVSISLIDLDPRSSGCFPHPRSRSVFPPSERKE
jgi:phosphoenolpyruvate---glycerone phosphotransferase subunit DhaK